MLNILLVDSLFINNEVIKFDVVSYFKRIDKECTFFETDSSEEALSILKKNSIDIAFIDVGCKILDGVSLIKVISEMQVYHPHIIAVLGLGNKRYRYKLVDMKINEYIYKPYDYKEIYTSLDLICEQVCKSTDIDITVSEDEDEFFDFDDELEDDSIESTQSSSSLNSDKQLKELMDKYNNSHTKISAATFLNNYDESLTDSDELVDLIEEMDLTLSDIMFKKSITEDELNKIINILERFNSFLCNFVDFNELIDVNQSLISLLLNLENVGTSKNSKAISKFVVAILGDLADWIKHLFIQKDSVDICYINASILSSYIQLKDMVDSQ
jgi:DNA-binding response OmpR family regulator